MPRFSHLLALLAFGVSGAASAQSDCSHYALVSGYRSNVHIYDGCSGAYLRNLDTQAGRLRGAQAVKLGPDGALWVVSELTAQVHRYHAEDFSFLGTPVNVGAGFGLTGIAFRGTDEVYAGGYDGDSVRVYSLAGQQRSTPVSAAAGAGGPDNGLTFGPDGLLYVPGYDTHNIVRHNPTTGQSTILVPAGTGGLRSTRGILFRPDGETFLVSSEGSGQILEFRRDTGALVRELARGLPGPTGMDWGPDGSLVVANLEGDVVRLDPNTGASRGFLIAGGSGGLNGPTYLFFLRKPGAVTPPLNQVGTQFWISGLGRLDGRRLVVDAMQSTTGPTFGADYDPADARSARWGQITIDFSGCSAGTMQWNSTGSDSAGFGSGGYALSRLLPSAAVDRCNGIGFAQSPPEDWLSGIWSGGLSRNGEGFVFEYVNATTVAVAWFTHRPATAN